DPLSEEEEGRIHHEYRAQTIDGKSVSSATKDIIARLGPAWGGTTEEFCYYGSVDATPLFLRLLEAFHQRYPERNILERDVPDRPGKTLAKSAAAAAQWLEGKMDASSFGFIESRRTNPHGHLNQVWQDSRSSYI